MLSLRSWARWLLDYPPQTTHSYEEMQYQRHEVKVDMALGTPHGLTLVNEMMDDAMGEVLVARVESVDPEGAAHNLVFEGDLVRRVVPPGADGLPDESSQPVYMATLTMTSEQCLAVLDGVREDTATTSTRIIDSAEGAVARLVLSRKRAEFADVAVVSDVKPNGKAPMYPRAKAAPPTSRPGPSRMAEVELEAAQSKV